MKRYLDIPVILFVITILASSCATFNEPAPVDIVIAHRPFIQAYEDYQDFVIYKMKLLRGSRLLTEVEARDLFNEHNDVAWAYFVKANAALAEGDLTLFEKHLARAKEVMQTLEKIVDDLATSSDKKFVPTPHKSGTEL